ncbi:flagellin C-terminal helical region [Bradyrhizobium lablabi]|uniref:Flagellin n=1 Tax=Bradyrhizobium lablabi TaxID=722472 RepID=A0A1M7BNN9_9BRAD|nr:flagellin [Bradyrhizobium lablabi]SHL56668.1 flagellin C-terminal helical region [Bradyrhizobium lablabi]
MSGIVLSAAVRQNLLSLQNTAELLSTTQNRLASGKKVNTALDNPTNFFTAQGLDNRASDINNLLDAIGNGVQVLQAANTGLTSLQKLVDTAKSIANQVLQTTTGYTQKASATSLAPTGSGAGTATDLVNIGSGTANSLSGKTFIFTPATGAATTITLGTGAGQVNSITAFNTALTSAGLGLTASLATNGSITLTSTNDNASQTLTTTATAAPNNIGITGTDTATLVTPTGGTAGAPLADPNSQTTRASLVAQYNNIIAQITTTSQDSSFNGINLLFGDDLKLTFNETGKSTLNIKGVTYDATGLGLGPLVAGTDFLDNSSANAVIAKVSAASDQLRSEASSLGSNLSIVQIRQNFAKNLINVLQTGSANLTLADSNEEAANSQALSTRQSIAVSALALSNQSQQSVLQLLR